VLQNRVDPFGNLIQTKARGLWLGNRGQLHGKGKTILRPFKHKAWISCLLEFKDRHREIMAPNLWTELFFLDEATTLAAGHRPCFECRKADAKLFKEAWIKGNPDWGFDMKTPIGKIDEVLHAERIDKNGNKITFEAEIRTLPDGVFIEFNHVAYLINDNQCLEWTPIGYAVSIAISANKIVNVLTPKSIVNALRNGLIIQRSK
jgi:hypothetical protein